METSFMYHAFGIREQECTRTHHKDGKIIFEIGQSLLCQVQLPSCEKRSSSAKCVDEREGKIHPQTIMRRQKRPNAVSFFYS